MSARAHTELLHGKGAHADPIACIEDISADLAGHRVAGFPHSIADLVFHMNFWMDYELRRIRGQRPQYPAHNADTFPASSQIDAEGWNRLRAEFANLISQYTALANSPREELDRQVETVHAGDTNIAGTVEAVLIQMIAHNSYHAGQIAMIRRMLNAWPPKAGGDSW